MSAADVETLGRIYTEWAKGNFFAFDSFDPDVRTRWATEVPDLEGSVGIDGLTELLRSWLSAWEQCRIEAEEFHEAGDRVVVFVRVVARGSGSSIDVEMENAHVWTMRDGKALSIRAYTDRERAIREAGSDA
jgi:ketosteroid isomerase-like protein